MTMPMPELPKDPPIKTPAVVTLPPLLIANEPVPGSNTVLPPKYNSPEFVQVLPAPSTVTVPVPTSPMMPLALETVPPLLI